ncbi:MAG: thioredoxin [Candidatus Hepatoplasma scabrum]|nr:MAG: thioredoxin [Candidatus Hepatoplasma sp.]
MITEFSENKFNQFIKEKKLFVVDFFAVWCGPCKMFAPVYKEGSDQYASKGFTFLKVDVDEHTNFAANQGVTSVPTIVIYKDGKEFNRWSGATNLENFKKRLDEAL